MNLTQTHPGKEMHANKLSNLADLWMPLAKALFLGGMVVGKSIIRDEPAKTLAVGNVWQPTCNPKSVYQCNADLFIQDDGNLGNYENPEPSLTSQAALE